MAFKLNVYVFNDRDHAVDLKDAGVIDLAIGVSPTRNDGRIRTTAPASRRIRLDHRS